MAEEHVQRVARRMGDTEDEGGGDELAAVSGGDRRLNGEGVDEERDRGDRSGRGQGPAIEWAF
jgi:hypothetical protein